MSQSLKCPISALSSPDHPTNKIPQQDKTMLSEEKAIANNTCITADETSTKNLAPGHSVGNSESTKLQQVIGPLIKEFRLLWESVDSKYTSLESAIEKQKAEVSDELSKIEKSLAFHRKELTTHIDEKVSTAHSKMNKILDENKKLRNENSKLLERIQRIEIQQLSNNVIISGITEAPWEQYESTKQCVHDTVAACMGYAGDAACQERTKQVEIMCCSCVGRFRPNHNCLISATFQKKDDKEMLMNGKKLPPGIYVNKEFPLEI